MILIMLFFITNVNAQEKDSNVIYEYKKYESFDLGNLEIKGRIIAPGDISVKERERKIFSRSLLDRDDFNKEVKQDIKNLR